MPSKRQVLEQLTREELQLAAEAFEVHVEDRRVRDHLVDGLASARRASVAVILELMSRDRLKDICSGLDLSDVGREKGTLIARILGEEAVEHSDHVSGEGLYNARMSVGLSQAEVGERLGVSQATVSNWENDRGHPTDEQARTLSQFLDVPRPGQRGAERDSGGDEVSAFGVWLSKARNEARRTVPELANRSGVSAIQIANIEAGRTQNPRTVTRDRLITALGKPAPTEAIAATEREAEVTDLGSLIDFEPHEADELPTDPGVYVFYDVSNRPIYVGESGNIRTRVKGHADKFWFKRPIVETAAYIRISDQKMRRQVEQILIRFLKSNAVINRQHVDRE